MSVPRGYSRRMTRSRPYRSVILIAVLMLALTSFASAQRMAPSADSPQMAAFMAMGGTLDDLCGDAVPAHRGQCPFCHVTADARNLRPVGQVWDLVPRTAPAVVVTLMFDDQRDHAPWLARGPPRAA